jgi:hypothetical protein
VDPRPATPTTGGVAHADVLPAVNVRAVIHDERIFVCLADLMVYVEAASNVPDAPRRQIAGLLARLGEALERD